MNHPLASPQSKDDLEREKLALEVRVLSRPWWRRGSTYATFVPIGIALLAGVQGLRSGFFDRQRQLLELRERQLQIAVSDLEGDRDSLQVLIRTAAAVRARSMLTMQDIKRTRSPELEREFAATFPEFAGAFGEVEVHSDSTAGLTLRYLMLPVSTFRALVAHRLMADSMVAYRLMADAYRLMADTLDHLRDSLLLLDSLRRRLSDLQTRQHSP